jgi:hypothetical protein
VNALKKRERGGGVAKITVVTFLYSVFAICAELISSTVYSSFMGTTGTP